MIFLPFPSLHVEQRAATPEEGIIFVVSLTTENGNCPDCSHSSSRVHSHYQRTLKDLPSSGLPVKLLLQVRRFFCDNPCCSRKTFAEVVPDLVDRYARRTIRLTDILRQLGFALGGEQGARIAAVLKMMCSERGYLSAAHPPGNTHNSSYANVSWSR